MGQPGEKQKTLNSRGEKEEMKKFVTVEGRARRSRKKCGLQASAGGGWMGPEGPP